MLVLYSLLCLRMAFTCVLATIGLLDSILGWSCSIYAGVNTQSTPWPHANLQPFSSLFCHLFAFVCLFSVFSIVYSKFSILGHEGIAESALNEPLVSLVLV